jgi:hypothetical protein
MKAHTSKEAEKFFMSHEDILTQRWKDALQVEAHVRHTYISNLASFYGFHILLKKPPTNFKCVPITLDRYKAIFCYCNHKTL